ncbi:hypothetical protein, partial [Chryseobacterium hispalense]|uniref:hypothetical protein n=1 Tax=Chryseobacterium hispalense TaxID=1453492 RepID=UPI00391DDA43
MATFSTLPNMRPGLNGVFELFLIFFAGDLVGENFKKASSESGNGYKKTSEKFRRLLLSFYLTLKFLYSCP